MEQESIFDFYVLPEECISHILSLTSPRDACRSSLVSSKFRSAADSDCVWQKFLPSDYEEIISRSVSPLPFSSKKNLYFSLCDDPILIDNGNKSFALEKWNGKKCYMIGARELSIAWGDTPVYWKWIPLPDSRFSEVAELLVVSWLDIGGRMETRMLSPSTTYVAYLVFKLTGRTYGLQTPAEVSVRLAGDGDGDILMQTVFLDPNLRSHVSPPARKQLPHERGDGWMEIEMGEFFNDQGDDGEVAMFLKEVRYLGSKSGLIIQGIEVRPKRE